MLENALGAHLFELQMVISFLHLNGPRCKGCGENRFICEAEAEIWVELGLELILDSSSGQSLGGCGGSED